MTRDELKKYTSSIIYKEPNVYKYNLKGIENWIKNSVLYKKHCYCPRCRKVVLAIENRFVKKVEVVDCSECRKAILVDRVSDRSKKQRIIRFLFDVLDYKDDCLINQTYCITHYYDFKSGELKFKEKFFKVGTEVYDLVSNYRCCMDINVYKAHMGYKYIFPFEDAYAKNARYPFYEQNICYHYPYEDVYYFCYLEYTNNLKKRFFKYIDVKKIESDFGCNNDIISFLKCLYVYPKIETLYKLEKYTWTDKVYQFYDSVIDCLKKKKGFEKYDYHLLKAIYTSKSQGRIDFNYYRVNLKLGKPYVNNQELIDFLVLHKKYISRETVNYLINQNCGLYDDYMIMAEKMKLDLSSKKVKYPKNLKEAHDDLVLKLGELGESKEILGFLELKERYSLLEFEEKDYIFYLPTSNYSFKYRGSFLKQCLSSANYDKRHLEGKCIIVYIDYKDPNLKEYQFTLELNKKLEIIQLHGFCNDINYSKTQKQNLSVVKEIVQKRLDLLKMKNGQVVYKNNIFHSSGKKENAEAF